MHQRTVVTLRIILEDQFPVRLHVVFNSPRGVEFREVPMRELSGQRREHFRERYGTLGEVYENESFPYRQGHRMQRMLRFIEALDFVHVRGTDQSAIQTIRPGMVRALERLAELPVLFLAQPCPAMAADIIESARLPALVPQDNQAFTRHLCHEISTGLRDLALMANTQPLCGKNPCLFLREN